MDDFTAVSISLTCVFGLAMAVLVVSRRGSSFADPFSGADWITIGVLAICPLTLTAATAQVRGPIWAFVGVLAFWGFISWIMYDNTRAR